MLNVDQPPPPPLHVIDDQIRIALGMTIRGIIASFGFVPPDQLFSLICGHTGRMCAEAMVTDLTNNLRVRKLMKEFFEKSVNEAPVRQPQMRPPGMNS